MRAVLERITIFCFGASYAVALAFELAGLLRPHRLLVLSLVAPVHTFGAGGLP
jgi:hypothetical protein